ncbi:hypothetical protein CRE_28592 [Caenorhabditis remanei]|uniref:Domain of unknown function WSN domain-containing protein n=1 Tax=Caenorhabditis remanei TaxID=31234 RepID=E3LN92_CAERE|nr:hypothetical protein CRE_28592 [Caenorhabditis remanei]
MKTQLFLFFTLFLVFTTVLCQVTDSNSVESSETDVGNNVSNDVSVEQVSTEVVSAESEEAFVNLGHKRVIQLNIFTKKKHYSKVMSRANLHFLIFLIGFLGVSSHELSETSDYTSGKYPIHQVFNSFILTILTDSFEQLNKVSLLSESSKQNEKIRKKLNIILKILIEKVDEGESIDDEIMEKLKKIRDKLGILLDNESNWLTIANNYFEEKLKILSDAF